MDKYIKSMPFNMLHLCIDQYKDYQISGTVYTTSTDKGIKFMDINEIILYMDEIFNKNGNPLSSSQKRSFTKNETVSRYQNKPPVLCSYDEIMAFQGKILTIDIVIKARRNSSWQGIIFYQNQVIVFSTILEMIKNIVKILNTCEI